MHADKDFPTWHQSVVDLVIHFPTWTTMPAWSSDDVGIYSAAVKVIFPLMPGGFANICGKLFR